MSIDEISSWSSLIEFLEGWTSANGDPYIYDVNGILAILGACLTNLSKYSIDADFEEMSEFFDQAQIDILRKILNGCAPAAS